MTGRDRVLVVVLGRFLLRKWVVRMCLVSRGVVEARRSSLGRSLEVDWVRERLIEVLRRAWRVLQGSGMPTKLGRLTRRETIDEEHQCGGPDLVYHDSGRP